MAIFVIMVGLPCSGKTSFVKNNFKDYTVLSLDSLIDIHAGHSSSSYERAWEEAKESANEEFHKLLREAIKNKYDIVIDRTNLTQNVRQTWCKMLPAYYNKVAIFIDTPLNICEERNLQRRSESDNGKFIPQHIMRVMYDRLFLPTEDEGFDIVQTIKGY